MNERPHLVIWILRLTLSGLPRVIGLWLLALSAVVEQGLDDFLRLRKAQKSLGRLVPFRSGWEQWSTKATGDEPVLLQFAGREAGCIPAARAAAAGGPAPVRA